MNPRSMAFSCTNLSRLLTLRSARTVSSFALLGSITFGAFLSWLPIGFDVHIPGAFAGAVAGLFFLKHQ